VRSEPGKAPGGRGARRGRTLSRDDLRDADAARDKALGDLRALSGVSRLPRRVKCAMLAWDALEEAEKKLAAR